MYNLLKNQRKVYYNFNLDKMRKKYKKMIGKMNKKGKIGMILKNKRKIDDIFLYV